MPATSYFSRRHHRYAQETLVWVRDYLCGNIQWHVCVGGSTHQGVLRKWRGQQCSILETTGAQSSDDADEQWQEGNSGQGVHLR